jgi:hypothetical protein
LIAKPWRIELDAKSTEYVAGLKTILWQLIVAEQPLHWRVRAVVQWVAGPGINVSKVRRPRD